jgi:predicted dehydrogenase
MAHTLEEADRMVKVCAEAGAPLSCGAITTTHPSFARARDLIRSGHIGPILSMEAYAPCAQHQNWMYFLEGRPAWVIGTGDIPRRESGTDEFMGSGMLVTDIGLTVHFRKGAPGVRISGEKGEMTFDYSYAWKLWKDIDTPDGVRRVETPWPSPQFVPPYGGVYSLADIMDCLAGSLDEPKNSGRRVAMALEVEIALKQSSALGGQRVDLPLADRSLGLHYEWFR